MSNNVLKDSIKKLFAIMNTLQNEYSEYNKKFTLDGRLVGDLGEIVCAEHYGIELFDKVEPIYDGVIKGTTNKVQIKTTFHESLTFPCNKKHIPEYYLGIKLYEDGFFEEIYNGNIISRKSGQKIQKIANLQYYKSKANYGTKKKGISR